MKKISIVLGVLFGSLVFAGCSKGDCVCTYTSSENGVVISSSSTTSSGSGISGPLGDATDNETCNFGDDSYTYTSGGITYSDVTECELE